MVNQSVIDSSVNLEQLKDIEDLIPDMDKAISEKVETFLDKSGDQPYAHLFSNIFFVSVVLYLQFSQLHHLTFSYFVLTVYLLL